MEKKDNDLLIDKFDNIIRDFEGKKSKSISTRNLVNEMAYRADFIFKLYAYVKTQEQQKAVPLNAFEWLLDNCYVLKNEYEHAAGSLQCIKKLPSRDFNGRLDIFSYRAAELFCNTIDFTFSQDSLIEFLRLLGKKYDFEYKEIYLFLDMLRLAVISAIFVRCKKLKALLDKGSPLTSDNLFWKNSLDFLRALNDIDIEQFSHYICAAERILLTDRVYSDMTKKSKQYYRRQLEKLAKRNKIEPACLAESLMRKVSAVKDGHIGELLFASKNKGNKALYFYLFAVVTVIACVVPAVLLKNIFVGVIALFPSLEIAKMVADRLMVSVCDDGYMVRLDLSEGIPQNLRTCVAVSVLISEKNIANIKMNLEMQYLKNRQDNLLFGVIADFCESDTEVMQDDKRLICAATDAIFQLNKEYGQRFFLLLRGRTYATTQNKYIGWERKRGAVVELVKFIKGENIKYAAVAGAVSNLTGCRYVILLDSDTNMSIDNAQQLVSAVAHPLNRPVIENGRVIRGHAVIAPSIIPQFAADKETFFLKLFSGRSGIERYKNTSFEIYQSVFDEGIFTGKGIIDVDAYHQLLCSSLPENKILSHDLLEGCILRCGLASDVRFYDKAPNNLISFQKREHRWIRGDWQLLSIIKLAQLNSLDRWKIIDNLRRSLNPLFVLIAFLTAGFLPSPAAVTVMLTALLSIAMPFILTLINQLFSGDVLTGCVKYFSRSFNPIANEFLVLVCNITFLPFFALSNSDAVIRALYRQFVSHKHTLDWVTADQTNNIKAQNIMIYGLALSGCVLCAGFAALISYILAEFYEFAFASALLVIFSFLWLISPATAFLLGRENCDSSLKLSEYTSARLFEYAKLMWKYFEEFLNEKDNYLLPDNFQEVPPVGLAHRTSPTNIGFSLMSLLCARDFGFITTAQLVNLSENIISAITELERYRGHLYNWYDTVTKKPLEPRYISTVDSGNFAVCLCTLACGLREYSDEDARIDELILKIRTLENEPDFKFLYNPIKKLLHIGFDNKTNKLSGNFYDLFMSESRLTSFYLIARGIIPPEHWATLSRLPVTHKGYFGYKSWAGTAFEYFMPCIFLPTFKNTAQYEAISFAFHAQVDRVSHFRRNLPFGVSESCFYAFDKNLCYQYKAMGVERLGLKRNLNNELVISPYSSFLSLHLFPKRSAENFALMENEGFIGKYGFYEAIDYTQQRTNGQYSIVKCFMAHHIGMSFLSVGNYFFDGVFTRRFLESPEMSAYTDLLQERLPDKVYIGKNYEPRTLPTVTHHYSPPSLTVNRISRLSPKISALSNGKYTTIISDGGAGFSIYDNKTVTRYRRSITEDCKGVYFAIKTQSGMLSLTAAPVFDNSAVTKAELSSGKVEFYASKNDIQTVMKVYVHSELNAEVREIVIKNTSVKNVSAALLCYLEPVLVKYEDEINHPAFWGLSIQAKEAEQENAVVFTRRQRNSEDKTAAVCIGFCDSSADVCFETTREKIWNKFSKSEDIFKLFNKNFSGVKPACIDPCFAAKLNLNISAKASVKLIFVMACAENEKDAVDAFVKIKNQNSAEMQNNSQALAKRTLSLFGISKAEQVISDNILADLIYSLPQNQVDRFSETVLSQPALWKYGVSDDLPIILVRLSDYKDIAKIVPYIKVFRLLCHKTVSCELVISFNDSGQYNRPFYTAVYELLRQNHTEHLVGFRCGIHLCNVQTDQDSGLLQAVAAHIIDFDTYTGRKNEYTSDKLVPIFKTESLIDNKESDLKNQHGSFYDDGFIISEKMLYGPPWCDILANDSYGTVLSDSSLGYSYAFNSSLFKITPWYNDIISDNYGEKLIIKYKGRLYDLISNAQAVFHKCYVEYTSKVDELKFKITVFVPIEIGCKIIQVNITNLSEKQVSADIAFGADFVLGRKPHEFDRMIRAKIYGKALFLSNRFHSDFSECTAYLFCKNSSFFGLDKVDFLQGNFNSKSMRSGQEAFAYTGTKLNLQPGQVNCGYFALGCDKNDTAALKSMELIEGADIARLFSDVRKRGLSEYSPLEISTPDGSFNDFVNTFLYYQVIMSRIKAKTAFYQSSGAFGFRDQLQDCMSICSVAPDYLKQQIMRSCSHQFVQGDVMHWWHTFTQDGILDRGVRTHCSDDLLWLPLAVSEYVQKTGDYDFLNCPIAYLDAPELEQGRLDAYITACQSNISGSVYEHCIRAFMRGLQYGSHGLLLFGTGDWCDGFSHVGAKRIGESIWLSMFAVYVIGEFLPVCKFFKDDENYTSLLSHKIRLVESVEEHGWDGQWYLRGFYDDGSLLGSASSDECRIDLMSQTFSAICGNFDEKRVESALNAAEDLLIDEENGLVKLFTPAFTGGTQSPGYVKGYVEGVRENGGQYSHGACFAAYAYYRIGRPDEAYRILSILNPAKKYDIGLGKIYKNEPYVLSGDVYSAPEFVGRGGWSWYTGAAGWYFRLVLENLLGISIKEDRVTIRPMPPTAWDNFSFSINLRGTELNVSVHKGNKINMIVDGQHADDICLDGKKHDVKLEYA